jgi:hypothetical protein
MITKYNNVSLAFGIPGIVLQLVGAFAPSVLVQLLGTALLIVGLAYYAKAKGRNPAWCLFAFLSIIGLIVLACLKDRSVTVAKS